MDQNAVPLVGVLAVTVGLFQQHLRVADLTADATAWHSLEVGACAERLCAQLLHKSRFKNPREPFDSYSCKMSPGP